MLTLLFLLAFQDPHIPDDEITKCLGFEDNTTTPIERTIRTENDRYITEHTDTTGLLVVSQIDRKTLTTIRIEKFRHKERTLEVICDSNGALVRDFKKNKEKYYEHSGKFYDRHTLFEVFRGYPFEKQKEEKFDLLVPERGIFGMEVEFQGRDTVRTIMEEIECFKLMMKPSGILGFIVRIRFYFYFATKPPHPIIMFSDNKGREIRTYAVTGFKP